MADTKPSKMIQKKDKKTKERDSSVKAVTAALKTLPPEEQVSMLLTKYTEVAEENKKLQTNMKGVERQAQVLQRDKDQLETEHTKVILAKSKLESLCRELQKQNKLVKEENLARLREEEERRKEVSTKFNVTLSEISNLMKENSDKNSKLRDENQDMATKLQDLVKQYESREAHVDKMIKQKELQCQLSEARLAKQQIEMTEDKEKMLLEKKTLLEEVASYQKKTQEMSLNEIGLRTQLNSYMEKYEEFQNTLEKSNKIFHTFKQEMQEMAKKIKKTEKDTKVWKDRWEGANKALLEMVGERSLLEKQLSLQLKQNKQLQNLCRALQQQLTEIRNKDKSKPQEEEESKGPQILDCSKDTPGEGDLSGDATCSLQKGNCAKEEASLPVMEGLVSLSENNIADSELDCKDHQTLNHEESASQEVSSLIEACSLQNGSSSVKDDTSIPVMEKDKSLSDEICSKETGDVPHCDTTGTVCSVSVDSHVETAQEKAGEVVHKERGECMTTESSVYSMEAVD